MSADSHVDGSPSSVVTIGNLQTTANTGKDGALGMYQASSSIPAQYLCEFEKGWNPLVKLVNSFPQATQAHFGRLMMKVGRKFFQPPEPNTIAAEPMEDPLEDPSVYLRPQIAPAISPFLRVYSPHSLSKPKSEAEMSTCQVLSAKHPTGTIPKIPSLIRSNGVAVHRVSNPASCERSPQRGSPKCKAIQCYADIPFIYRPLFPPGIKVTPAMLRAISASTLRWGHELGIEDIEFNQSILRAFTRRFLYNRRFRKQLYDEAVHDARVQRAKATMMATPRLSLERPQQQWTIKTAAIDRAEFPPWEVPIDPATIHF